MQASFVDLDEAKISELKKVWNQNCMYKLIFDEAPHKYYMVRVDKATSAKHLAFENNGRRYYNGEITFNFISYFPYALSHFDSLQNNEYSNLPIELKGYWEELNEIPRTRPILNISDNSLSATMEIYNPGDLPAIFSIWIDLTTPQVEHEDGTIELEKALLFDLDISQRSIST
jgi:hypothetical protein